MKLLIGTGNPSKARYFAELLAGTGVECVSLREAGITETPEETGRTPLENAKQKAVFYAQYADAVVCADSGLYFDALERDDSRQPGVHIRTPQGGKRLDDDEMIAYYARLVRSLGGRVRAYYMDAFALCLNGQIHEFEATREEALAWAFDMVDTPCVWRREGWPLDSLSLEDDGSYFLDPGRPKGNQAQDEAGYRERLRRFLYDKLAGE